MGQKYTLAVLGGTGNEGPGLAMRWAKAGHTVIIGSREAEKAQRVADEINTKLGAPRVSGMANADAARTCAVAVLTVPYAVQNALLETLRDTLQGKTLINVNVAMKPPHVAQVYIPPEGSAAEQAQAILGSGVDVVAAFQNVGAATLENPDHPIACDVLVCGDKKAAKAIAIQLAADIGTRGIDAGPLVNAKVVEGLTSVLIGINIRYKVPGSGIRITGLPEG
ncbi:MAG TPA: NADPH-dependent F420 reductase [Anaerolineae bacterium]|nr:NADPH-dependent F420 reductase [Anaerolineae bacterium]HQH38256.1 NADPH-dependent F420 reductase [Anaerolineae bacterium]